MLLPDPLTPVTRHKTPSGNSTVTFFRLFPLRAGQADPAVIGRAAAAVGAETAPAGQIIARQAVGRLLHLGGRALKDDLAAAFAGPGPDLDDLVGRANDRLFVFHDDHRVAAVAELLDGGKQLMDVAGMKADRRLVEHVEHVYQARTQRGGQRHAADLAAAEGAQRAVERQVAEPHRLEIRQPRLHLFEHHAADLPLPVGQLQIAKEGGRVADLHGENLADVLAAQPGGQGLGPQPRAAAGRAGAKTPPAAQEHADVHLVLPPLQPGEKTLQPAKFPLRHPVENQLPMRAPKARGTARPTEGHSRGPGRSVLSVRGRTPACSTGRWPLRAATWPGRERRGPCRCR